MDNDWSLRESVFVAAHRWPLMAACFLLGGLLGWFSAYLWPAPYRASLELAVGLNPYRSGEDRYLAAFANTEFRNPDDYKHWQMAQLGVLASSDEYLQETLARLRGESGEWQGVGVAELRGMLRATWRNAGRWRLTAEAADPALASQAVQAWREVIVEKANQAIGHSRKIFLLDIELQAIVAERTKARLKQETLPRAEAWLEDWRETAQASGGGALPTLERWRLVSLAASACPERRELLAELPPPQAARPEYLPWIERLRIAIEQEGQAARAELAALEQRNAQVLAEWETSLQAASGLSATLSVEVLNGEPPQVDRPRPASLSALAGSLLGALAWGLWLLIRVMRRVQA